MGSFSYLCRSLHQQSNIEKLLTPKRREFQRLNLLLQPHDDFGTFLRTNLKLFTLDFPQWGYNFTRNLNNYIIEA
jgi:hypothetical protein